MENLLANIFNSDIGKLFKAEKTSKFSIGFGKEKKNMWHSELDLLNFIC